MSDLAGCGRSPAEHDVGVVLDDSRSHKAVVCALQGSIVLGRTPVPLDEPALVLLDELGGCEVVADHIGVGGVLVLYLPEQCVGDTLQDLGGCVLEVVGDVEVYPLVGAHPLDLEVLEGSELRLDILVSVSLSDLLEYAFHFHTSVFFVDCVGLFFPTIPCMRF